MILGDFGNNGSLFEKRTLKANYFSSQGSDSLFQL